MSATTAGTLARDVARRALAAIAERVRHPAPEALVGVTEDADHADAALLHVNSGGNALACTAALQQAGYECAPLPAEPGQYGVRIRVYHSQREAGVRE